MDIAESEKVTISAIDLEWVEQRLRTESTEQTMVAERRQQASRLAQA